MLVLELTDIKPTSSPKARNSELLQMYLEVIGIWVVSIQTQVPVEACKGVMGVGMFVLAAPTLSYRPSAGVANSSWRQSG